MSTELSVESSESVRKVDSVVVVVRDTIMETTTITIRENEQGDTLRQSIVTDRYRGRDFAQVSNKETEVRVVRDTIYVEKRDSVLVETNTNLANGTDKRTTLVGSLKWIFWIIVALTGLIIVIWVALRLKI